MTDMQTSLPLLIVQPCILNSVMHFSTHLWPVKWNALQVIPLPCAFHFIFSNVGATQPPTSIELFDHYHESTLGLIILEWYDPLHIIMWPYWFGSQLNFLFTIVLDHRRQVLLKLPLHMWFVTSKPPTCPSHLQLVHRCKALSRSSLFSHKQYSMSCLMCNDFLHHTISA